MSSKISSRTGKSKSIKQYCISLTSPPLAYSMTKHKRSCVWKEYFKAWNRFKPKLRRQIIVTFRKAFLIDFQKRHEMFCFSEHFVLKSYIILLFSCCSSANYQLISLKKFNKTLNKFLAEAIITRNAAKQSSGPLTGIQSVPTVTEVSFSGHRFNWQKRGHNQTLQHKVSPHWLQDILYETHIFSHTSPLASALLSATAPCWQSARDWPTLAIPICEQFTKTEQMEALTESHKVPVYSPVIWIPGVTSTCLP